MHLYFSPMACSLSARIALYEAGAQARFTRVDLKNKRTVDGRGYWDIAPLGQVPALETEEGALLTENTAVLQYVADRFPQARLAPSSGPERARLQQWLGFISTEIHKTIFTPMLEEQASAEVKAYARTKLALRFDYLQNHLSHNEYLLPEFTIADAYLLVLLNWTVVTDIDLERWPALAAYRQRLLKRPSIAKAVGEEMTMWREEQARLAAAAANA